MQTVLDKLEELKVLIGELEVEISNIKDYEPKEFNVVVDDSEITVLDSEGKELFTSKEKEA